MGDMMNLSMIKKLIMLFIFFNKNFEYVENSGIITNVIINRKEG